MAPTCRGIIRSLTPFPVAVRSQLGLLMECPHPKMADPSSRPDIFCGSLGRHAARVDTFQQNAHLDFASFCSRSRGAALVSGIIVTV